MDLIGCIRGVTGKFTDNLIGGIHTPKDAVNLLATDGIGIFGIVQAGTPGDIIKYIERLQKQSGGFGCVMFLAHNCASFEATKKSYELFARYVMGAPPGGYLENGETLEDAASREVWEEAGVMVGDLALRGVTTLTRLQQVYVNFTAATRASGCRPGLESLDAAFFSPRDVPWNRLAFPSIAKDLEGFLRNRAAAQREVNEIYAPKPT